MKIQKWLLIRLLRDVCFPNSAMGYLLDVGQANYERDMAHLRELESLGLVWLSIAECYPGNGVKTWAVKLTEDAKQKGKGNMEFEWLRNLNELAYDLPYRKQRDEMR